MPGEDELPVFVVEGGDAADVLPDAPEMSIVQSQQGADEHLVHHPV